MKTVHIAAVFAVVHLLCQWVYGFGLNNKSDLCYPFVSYSFSQSIETLTAVNDTIIIAFGCENHIVSGNVMINDIFYPESVWVSNMQSPEAGKLSYDAFGNFNYSPESDFRGEVSIIYRLSAIENDDYYSEGLITIYVENDFDCDEIPDIDDLDDDNDGILDFHEGDLTVDTDGDGIPNCQDIDSDNDGITDFIEWQKENSLISLLICDKNGDGWDDAFDSQTGGTYYEQTDTDMDGIPDYLDMDSDDDGISDFVEAFDIQNNQNPTIKLSNLDFDQDGLDNRCDTIVRTTSRLNSIGSKSPLPDHNKNGIRDWRDPINNNIEGEAQNALGLDSELFVFPNPVINNCTVILPANTDHNGTPYSLKIFNTKGEMVHFELVYNNKNNLPLGKLQNGLYIIRVKIGNTVLSTKLIKSD
ncbi:T9SS type A sorting domain-containing protein [Prolixibacteraceae bacterium Z1-6]|uniref:T9SS type A sorting domain-containing protein n=1 Tax=Draconibacterium aestuarii TaxID=2998507 RepID=A0A9X3F9J9_9BACT|nr:T9SS type A sorting domain-containing protein [Prolixibacteraceae bacterium Z1-6]